jgi:hypothetical protein
MPDAEPSDLANAHGILASALELVISVRGLLQGASSDTLFAAGEAAGVISKAKALVGRDIDMSPVHAMVPNTNSRAMAFDTPGGAGGKRS